MPAKKPPSKLQKKQEEESIASLVERCDQMIERLDHLYKMYVAGVEKHPPREVRAQLDALLARLAGIPKPKVDAKFRYEGLVQKFGIYRMRWERLLKQLERG